MQELDLQPGAGAGDRGVSRTSAGPSAAVEAIAQTPQAEGAQPIIIVAPLADGPSDEFCSTCREQIEDAAAPLQDGCEQCVRPPKQQHRPKGEGLDFSSTTGIIVITAVSAAFLLVLVGLGVLSCCVLRHFRMSEKRQNEGGDPAAAVSTRDLVSIISQRINNSQDLSSSTAGTLQRQRQGSVGVPLFTGRSSSNVFTPTTRPISGGVVCQDTESIDHSLHSVSLVLPPHAGDAEVRKPNDTPGPGGSARHMHGEHAPNRPLSVDTCQLATAKDTMDMTQV